MKLAIYTSIMALEPKPISTAYFINPFHQSVCLYMHPTIVARQRLGKNFYRGNEYTRNNKRIIGRVIFYAAHVVSKESRRLVINTSSFNEKIPRDANQQFKFKQIHFITLPLDVLYLTV
jgi:hypothetical protein